jgi:cytochrome c556
MAASQQSELALFVHRGRISAARDVFVAGCRLARTIDRPSTLELNHGKRLMIRTLIVITALTVGVQAALPQNLDVIKQRKETMKKNGDAAGEAVKMMKGEKPFDLAAAQTALKTMVDTAAKMPALFPDDSKTGGDTKALPAIWTDKADVNARFAKFGTDASTALTNVKDKASFSAAMTTVFNNCGGCHEKYRVPQK